MTRNLRYITVEIGPCRHCHRDAGDHSVEGICGPLGTRPVYPTSPRQCYRGRVVHAFEDLNERIAQVEPVDVVA